MKHPLSVFVLFATLLSVPAVAQDEKPDKKQEEKSEEPATVSDAGDSHMSSDASPDASDEPPASDDVNSAVAPRLSLYYSSLNVLRGNPLGLLTDNTVGGRYRLFNSDSLLLKDTYVGLALVPAISGTFARLGARAEVQPLAIIRLWAQFDAFGYYGIIGAFQSYDDPSKDFSDTAIRDAGALEDGNPKRNYSTTGTQLTLGMDLKIKFGPIAARSLSRLVRSDFDMRNGDRVFYDQTYDVLAPNHGFFFSNNTDVLGFWELGFLTGMRLIGGIRGNITAPLYSDSSFTPGSPDATSDNLLRQVMGDNGPIVRVGPLLAFTFFDDPGALFNKPTILVSAQWHILHRFRTGVDVHQAVPYAFIGFAMSGNFLGK